MAAVEAFRRGASDYVVKSDLYDHPDHLRKVVCEALRRTSCPYLTRGRIPTWTWRIM